MYICIYYYYWKHNGDASHEKDFV